MTPSIALLYDTGNISINSWNVFDLVEELTDQGVKIKAFDLGKPLDDLFDFDTAIFYRTLRQDYGVVISALKTKKIRVGFSVDDLIWDTRFPYAYWPELAPNFTKMLKLAEFFVLPSTFLAEKLAEEVERVAPGKKAEILYRMPGIPVKRFRQMAAIRDRIVKPPDSPFEILLSKGHMVPEIKATTIKTFQVIQGAFNRPVIVHYFSIQGETYPNYVGDVLFQRHAFREFDDYFRYIATLAPDLVFCPLPKDDFHECKSYPKYLEAGAIKADFLGTDVHPFLEVGFIRQAVPEACLPGALLAAINTGTDVRAERTRVEVEAMHLLPAVASQFYRALCYFLSK